MSGYTQKPAGKLRIELSGTGPGNYDVLAIGGNAQLDGQLEIVPLNFNPQPGQQFTIISASGAVTGTFASVTGGGEYTAIYNQNSVVVQVVAPLCMDYAVPDLDHDCDVDATDLQTLQACHSGPAIAYAPGCSDRDFDHDNDVDQCDFGVWQRCFTGPGVAAIPSCDQL